MIANYIKCNTHIYTIKIIHAANGTRMTELHKTVYIFYLIELVYEILKFFLLANLFICQQFTMLLFDFFFQNNYNFKIWFLMSVNILYVQSNILSFLNLSVSFPACFSFYFRSNGENVICWKSESKLMNKTEVHKSLTSKN